LQPLGVSKAMRCARRVAACPSGPVLRFWSAACQLWRKLSHWSGERRASDRMAGM